MVSIDDDEEEDESDEGKLEEEWGGMVSMSNLLYR